MADTLLDACEDLRFEPDLGWIFYTGASPEDYLKKYAHRCPVIHLKDVYARDLTLAGNSLCLGTKKADPEKGYFEFRPLGYGMLNLPKLMPACLKCAPEWMVLDHDLAYERDSFMDLKLSLDYTKTLLEIMPEAN